MHEKPLNIMTAAEMDSHMKEALDAIACACSGPCRDTQVEQPKQPQARFILLIKRPGRESLDTYGTGDMPQEEFRSLFTLALQNLDTDQNWLPAAGELKQGK